MQKELTERRNKTLKAKKEMPFQMKVRFIRDFIFRKFKAYANYKLNECGWQFDEDSVEHRLWKLFHCDMEEIERLYYGKLKIYQEVHGRNNFKPTEELREIFAFYLIRAFNLYCQSLKFCQPKNPRECYFYISWFVKNIKKYAIV